MTSKLYARKAEQLIAAAAPDKELQAHLTSCNQRGAGLQLSVLFKQGYSSL